MGTGINARIKNRRKSNAIWSVTYPDGFTLIELIVVITLLGIVLFFTVPRFGRSVMSDDVNKASRWIIIRIKTLKSTALKTSKGEKLKIDLDEGIIWAESESMEEEELEKARKNGYKLPENVKISNVEYPDGRVISSGVAAINFYKGGYSDKAIIHMEEDEERISLLIEPFLPKVRLKKEYVGY